MFESRLSKVGMGPKTNTFNELSNDNDLEEKVIHNTYLNGLNIKNENRSNLDFERKISNNNSKRISWADNNNLNRKDLLCNTNFTKDLFYQKDIKPILNHKKGKPIKSILKKRSASADAAGNKFKMTGLNNVTTSTNLNNSNINNQNAYNSSNYNSNSNNYGTNNSFINKSETKSPQDKGNNMNLSNNSIVNNFINNKNLNSSINNLNNLEPKKPLGQNNNYSNMNLTGMSNSNTGLSNNNSFINKENSNYNNNLNQIPRSSNNANNNMNNNSSALSRQNYFTSNNQNSNSNVNNNSNNPQQRSYSFDQKNENSNNRNLNVTNNSGNYGSTNNQGEMTKIIITPNIHSIYNHNINNYYIQSSNDMNFEKIRDNNTTPPSSLNVNNLNFDSNNYKFNERPNSVSKKDSNSTANSNNISPLNAQGNSFSYNNTSLLRNQNQLNTNNIQPNINTNNKLVKSLDNQRLLQNNFLNQNSYIE